jgi:hypothetical protein
LNYLPRMDLNIDPGTCMQIASSSVYHAFPSHMAVCIITFAQSTLHKELRVHLIHLPGMSSGTGNVVA